MSSSSKRSSTEVAGQQRQLHILLGCGCKDSKSTSVSDSVSDSFDKLPPCRRAPLPRPERCPSSSPPPSRTASNKTPTSPRASPASSASSTTSRRPSSPCRNRRQQRETTTEHPPCSSRSRRRRRQEEEEPPNEERGRGQGVEESVAVVKETEDPLGDFRRSMLQMIVEKRSWTGRS
ncbi:uncharacterized protein M6B38_407320 [Iris pallida]|uniref:Transcription repressor n=1 Tax=Iris pallida TaxID=29817 RepID=A0AAX6FP99_IRIPA|nr:uncharacterized protein M6B38_407320 [Iris pallida]